MEANIRTALGEIVHDRSPRPVMRDDAEEFQPDYFSRGGACVVYRRNHLAEDGR